MPIRRLSVRSGACEILNWVRLVILHFVLFLQGLARDRRALFRTVRLERPRHEAYSAEAAASAAKAGGTEARRHEGAEEATRNIGTKASRSRCTSGSGRGLPSRNVCGCQRTGGAEIAPAIHTTYRPIASLRPGSGQRRSAAHEKQPTLAGPGGKRRNQKTGDCPQAPALPKEKDSRQMSVVSPEIGNPHVRGANVAASVPAGRTLDSALERRRKTG
jgi:hypothetical protein